MTADTIPAGMIAFFPADAPVPEGNYFLYSGSKQRFYQNDSAHISLFGGRN